MASLPSLGLIVFLGKFVGEVLGELSMELMKFRINAGLDWGGV
jgi:hypothetical protein